MVTTDWSAVQRREKVRQETADEVARLYFQRERILAYLPRLYRQRDDAVCRLEDLEQLIADEESAVEEVAAQIA